MIRVYVFADRAGNSEFKLLMFTLDVGQLNAPITVTNAWRAHAASPHKFSSDGSVEV